MRTDVMKVNEFLNHCITRGRSFKDDLRLEGRYKIEHYRDGRLLETIEGKNLIVTAGKNYMLGVAFKDVTQIASTSWYVGLVDNASFLAYAASDVMSSHSGWIENVGYSGGTRVLWTPGSPSSASITNASPAVFNITATSTIKGIFLTSGSAQSGTTGTLWNAVSFTSNLSVTSGDQIKVTYTVSLS